MEDLRRASVQRPAPGGDFPREIRQHEANLERQLREMRQREENLQRELREMRQRDENSQRQLRGDAAKLTKTVRRDGTT